MCDIRRDLQAQNETGSTCRVSHLHSSTVGVSQPNTQICLEIHGSARKSQLVWERRETERDNNRHLPLDAAKILHAGPLSENNLTREV